MSDNKGLDVNNLSQNLINLFVTDIIKRYDIKKKKRELDEDQKQQLRNLVSDLKERVDSFIKNSQTPAEKKDPQETKRTEAKKPFRKVARKK